MGAPPTASEYTDLFVLQLYPYGSVYLGPEGMMGGEVRDRIAGFWRALGQTPPAEPDHLAVMLAQYASLIEGEAAERDETRRRAIAHARATFSSEHLLCWLPAYLRKVARDGTPTYRAWAALLRDVLAAATRRLEHPAWFPLHLREAPCLPEAGEVDRDTFVAGVLAPVRSGMILTRQDLARAARDTGLALRAGERRYALAALLDQDWATTWRWLESEACGWADDHAADEVQPNDMRRFWSERAASAAQRFAELALRAAPFPAPEATG